MAGTDNRIAQWVAFFREDIWRVPPAGFSDSRSDGLKRLLRVFFFSFWKFNRDGGSFKASALTFYTLLSIVPVAATAFGIAQGFGFERLLERVLLENFSGQETVVRQVIAFSKAMLDNTRGGLIAGTGVVVLLWSVIKVLGHIEQALNDIWDVPKGRSLGRKFGDYLSLVFIAPVLLLVSSSLNLFITTQVATIAEEVAVVGYFSPVIFFFLRWIPWAIVWVLFTFVYWFLPNTRVGFLSALFGGVLAGSAYQITQFMYLGFQVNIGRYNAIYGSFAALPLFLAWLQVSWLIVLSGAALCCGHQNASAYAWEPDRLNMSHAFRRRLALQLMHLLVIHFRDHRAPLTLEAVAESLHMPVRLARQILDELIRCRLVSEVVSVTASRTAYQPALDIHQITISFVVSKLESEGSASIPVVEDEACAAIVKALDDFTERIEKAPTNWRLMELSGDPPGPSPSDGEDR